MYIIFHNPRCSKSRETLGLLKEKVEEQQIQIKEYLKEIPSNEELKDVISKLNISAKDLIRVKEADFSEYKNKTLSDDEYVDLMIQYPKLIERPIVIKGSKAIIGRPPENVLSLI